MPIRRVWIEPGCVMCQMSIETCPEVFELDEEASTTRVKPGITDFGPFEAQIREAARTCPAEVMKFEED